MIIGENNKQDISRIFQNGGKEQPGQDDFSDFFFFLAT